MVTYDLQTPKVPERRGDELHLDNRRQPRIPTNAPGFIGVHPCKSVAF